MPPPGRPVRSTSTRYTVLAVQPPVGVGSVARTEPPSTVLTGLAPVLNEFHHLISRSGVPRPVTETTPTVAFWSRVIPPPGVHGPAAGPRLKYTSSRMCALMGAPNEK